MKLKDRILVGLTEKITVIGSNGRQAIVTARIDTGAVNSSIDTDLAARLQLGPVIKTKRIKSASGNSIRPVIICEVDIKGKALNANFTLAIRKHMKYKVLIGQDILKNGYLVDPMKK